MEKIISNRLNALYAKAYGLIERVCLHKDNLSQSKDIAYKQAFEIQMLCYRYVSIFHKEETIKVLHYYRLAKIAFLTKREDALHMICNLADSMLVIRNTSFFYEVKLLLEEARSFYNSDNVEYKRLTEIMVSKKKRNVKKPQRLTKTIMLNNRKILGFEQSGRTITKVDFEYPYHKHSFSIGDGIVWYFKSFYQHHKVSGFKFIGNELFVITSTNENLPVTECLHKSSFNFLT